MAANGAGAAADRWQQEQNAWRHRRACPGDLDRDGPISGMAGTSPAMTEGATTTFAPVTIVGHKRPN